MSWSESDRLRLHTFDESISHFWLATVRFYSLLSIWSRINSIDHFGAITPPSARNWPEYKTVPANQRRGYKLCSSSPPLLHYKPLLPTKQYFARLVRVEYDLDNFGARLSKGPYKKNTGKTMNLSRIS